MSLNVDIGSATVNVAINLDKNEPKYEIDIDIADSNPLGMDTALMALAAAARRMADEIDKQRANPSHATIVKRD